MLDKKTFPTITGGDWWGFFSKEEPMDQHTPYMFFPFFSSLEFISYMGWIKVAETLLNPFGDDDEVNSQIYILNKLDPHNTYVKSKSLRIGNIISFHHLGL